MWIFILHKSTGDTDDNPDFLSFVILPRAVDKFFQH